MIDVRRLRVLRELADHGTVAAAAAALHLTPSAVSQQLAALAREAGVQLVEPDGRRLRLTEAAHVLLGHAHRVFAQLEEAQAALARHAAGHRRTARVGGFPTALSTLVAPAVAALRAAEPRIDVHAAETDEPGCFAQLAAGDLDVVVSVESPGAPRQDDPRFHREPLLTDLLDAVLPADHPRACADRLELAQLATERWVVARPGTSCHDIVRVACAAAGFSPSAAHHTDDWTATGALVAAGGAVALVPRLAQSLMPDGVVVVSLSGVPAARHVFAAVRRGSHTDPTMAAVLGQLRLIAATCAAPTAPRPRG